LGALNNKYIGILGGTFDPPHEGHVFISKYALKRLGLKEVWWIVTQKNPLKFKSSDYKIRLDLAKKFLDDRNIKVVEVDEMKNLYAIDTIFYLKEKFKNKKFIWLMGADNIENLHLWKQWKEIFYNIPIAIFDRPSYSLNITKSKALLFFRKARIKNFLLEKTQKISLPMWSFISGPKNNKSSSRLRKNR
tara:strand:+ start:218 stop:787 length:570 start_codon:yes stop_codon:yes gene_type:complete